MEMILNDEIKKYSLILASGSPRRVELLRGMGFDFEIQKLDTDESYPEGINGCEIAQYVSKKKSNTFPNNKLNDNTIVITADTIVWQNDRAIEKPHSRMQAIEMLKALSENEHEVFTGVTIRSKWKTRSFYNRSKVWFRKLDINEIEYYIDNYKPYDKAGAYGVQEWIGYIAIERIEGSYFNVMGLPTRMLYQELKDFIK